MKEGALCSDTYFDRSKLINEVKKSWKIEVWDIKESHIEAFDEYWSRIINFRFLDRLDFKEIFQFNSLNINEKKFFNIVQKLDPTLFMVVDKVAIINNEVEYIKLMEILEGEGSVSKYQENKIMGEHLFNEAYIVLYMEAIKKLLKKKIKYGHTLILKRNLTQLSGKH